jgi:hypothetical protein
MSRVYAGNVTGRNKDKQLVNSGAYEWAVAEA